MARLKRLRQQDGRGQRRCARASPLAGRHLPPGLRRECGCRGLGAGHLAQTHRARPNQPRALRSISASVGKGVGTAVLPTLQGRAASGPAQNGSNRKSQATGPEQAPKQTPICSLVMPQPRDRLVLMRLDFLSVTPARHRAGVAVSTRGPAHACGGLSGAVLDGCDCRSLKWVPCDLVFFCNQLQDPGALAR